MKISNFTHDFTHGLKDGIPIGLGYFAVSFALGIAMKNAGLNWFEGFLMSLLNIASAGEYAGTQVILTHGSYLEMALMTLVANARYALMSCALAQKFSEKTPVHHRFLVGYAITDELFGIAISEHGHLKPFYFYGAVLASIPAWCIGTSLGILMGEVLPIAIVSALSVALYGMFLAIIIPPARQNQTVRILIPICFLTSYLSEITPVLKQMSAGFKIILLTIVIASIAAIVKPVESEES